MPAQAYDRFMGRYSEPLALKFVQLLAPSPGERALDVGCGPGALTALLVERLGPDAVSAIDPSPAFVGAARDRLPGVDVRLGSSRQLPYPDGTFDLVTAALVVHFMADPVRELQELARVARPGGRVAATTWDFAGDRSPLSAFYQAVAELDPTARDESSEPGAAEGQLGELFAAAGLSEVDESELTVRVELVSFEEWWAPMLLGVGPAGNYIAGLDEAARAELRAACARRLPAGPVTVEATAWVAVGHA